MKYATERYAHRSAETEEGGDASPARRRRWWRATSAAMAGMILLAVAGGGCSGNSGQHGATSSSSPSAVGRSRSGDMSAGAGVRSGVLFGGDVPLVTAESKLGRKLAIVRVYDHLGMPFSIPRITRIMAGGTTVLVSLDLFPSKDTYAGVAAGRDDAAIKSWLNEVEQAAVKYHLPAVYVTFEHEADVLIHHRALGTPAQFIKAWDHIHQLAAEAHLNWNDGGRMHWVLILTHFAYISGRASLFWPGPHEVDIVAADGYNTGGCRVARDNHTAFTTGKTPPETPASLFSKVVKFAANHGNLPVIIAEWGSVAYNNANVRVDWIHQMQAFVQANPEIIAALYWDSQVQPCNYIINNSPASLSALTGMAHAPDMQGRPTAS